MIRIDESVPSGLLFVSEYFQGIRSLKSVLAMSHLHNALHFSRSALPYETQLQLHVDHGQFVKAMRRYYPSVYSGLCGIVTELLESRLWITRVSGRSFDGILLAVFDPQISRWTPCFACATMLHDANPLSLYSHSHRHFSRPPSADTECCRTAVGLQCGFGAGIIQNQQWPHQPPRHGAKDWALIDD